MYFVILLLWFYFLFFYQQMNPIFYMFTYPRLCFYLVYFMNFNFQFWTLLYLYNLVARNQILLRCCSNYIFVFTFSSFKFRLFLYWLKLNILFLFLLMFFLFLAYTYTYLLLVQCYVFWSSSYKKLSWWLLFIFLFFYLLYLLYLYSFLSFNFNKLFRWWWFGYWFCFWSCIRFICICCILLLFFHLDFDMLLFVIVMLARSDLIILSSY